MNKSLLLQAILEALREEFESFRDSSRKTRAAGNDEESKSEGKYDTRSIEENYLADGLAKQAQAMAAAAAAYEKLEIRSFDEDSEIDLGALIRLEFSGGVQEWFFLGPGGGGIEVICEGTPVTVITPESPLGSQLMEKKIGDQTTTPATTIRAVS